MLNDLNANAVDEVKEGRHLSVDTGEARSGASVSPRDDTDLLSLRVNHWAPRVSLAGVLATFGKTSTDHGVIDNDVVIEGAVSLTAATKWK